jgi:eukaryotic-like serine/threonine-protein kinase
MLDESNCPVCGSVLQPDVPDGLCAACLLRQGLAGDESEPSCDDIEGVFERGELSAPASSNGKNGAISRLLLRDARSGDFPCSAISPGSAEMPARAHHGDRYQLLGEIARGGMGAVLKVRDPDLGRDLAIKVLLMKHRDCPELARRFIEEAQIGGQLEHPGIVPVYELGQFEDHRPYFAMKLVEGRTLAALLGARENAAQDLPRLLDIFEKVCQTMAYAHARGVIHRDLKPSNVMVGNFGEIQVMDWGLAKVMSRGGRADVQPTDSERKSVLIRTARTGSDAGISRVGSVFGTPAYMAPEQARGDLEQVDERADVFGLGAILCEILTGGPPYAGTDAREVQGLAARAELHDAFDRLGACAAERELVDLSRRCLAARPDDRPRDAGIVASEMTGYLRGMQERLRQAELERVEAQAKVSQEKTRRRLAVALAAAVVALIVTAGGGGLWALNQHHVRAARVDLLIRETELLAAQAEAAGDDLARWAAAREAVRRLLPVVDDARDSVTRNRVATLGKRVPKLAQAAEADAKLLERLALVRDAMDEIPATQTEAAYAAAFQAAGLDPHTQTPDQAGGAIARRPARTAVALAVALDHWAALRLDLGDRSSAGRITAVARAADPDQFRGRLRTALMEPRGQMRQAALLDLARSPAAAELPPVTSALLGAGLLRVGDPVAAESVLRPAQRRHPAEAWLAQVLAKTLEKRSRPAEAIRYYLIARAARPESAHALAHALERQGEFTEAIAVFHEAIRLNPASAGHRFCLGKALKSQGHAEEADLAFDAAVAAGREALRHQADDSLHHMLLGLVVQRPDRLDEVIAAYRTAIRQRPDDGPAHYYLGTILARSGQTDDAIAEYREAIRLKPDFTEGYIKLAMVLSNLKHDHAGAEKTLRDLIRFRADDHQAHFNLGCLLRGQGRLDEAMSEHRAAIRLNPDFAEAFCNLGEILSDVNSSGEEARAALREAIRLKPDDAFSHCNLANSLRITGRLDEAMAEYREAIRLEPRLAAAHYGLGAALYLQGKAGAAMTEYRETIRLKPDFAEVHCDLAYLLRCQGQYVESLVAYELGHELGSKRPDWAYPSAQWVAQARRLAQLAARLPALLNGEGQPADAAQCLDAAVAAYSRGFHAMAARFSARAFASLPSSAEDLDAEHRYNAACSAALAGCGKAQDQPPPDPAARVKLRRQALEWLEGDLVARSRIVAGGSQDVGPAARRSLVQKLERWKRDPDLAGVRELDALKEMNETERAGWQAFWADVDRALAQGSAGASDRQIKK